MSSWISMISTRRSKRYSRRRVNWSTQYSSWPQGLRRRTRASVRKSGKLSGTPCLRADTPNNPSRSRRLESRAVTGERCRCRHSSSNNYWRINLACWASFAALCSRGIEQETRRRTPNNRSIWRMRRVQPARRVGPQHHRKIRWRRTRSTSWIANSWLGKWAVRTLIWWYRRLTRTECKEAAAP